MEEKLLKEIINNLKTLINQNNTIIEIMKKSFDMALGGVDQLNGDYLNDEISGNTITG